MKPMPANVAITKQVATTRSARLAPSVFCGSAGSSRGRGTGGAPAVPGAGAPSIDRASAGGGVPITRLRSSAGPVSPWLLADWPRSWSPPCSLSPGRGPAVGSLIGLPVFRCDPHGGEDHEQQQPEECDQPLGDRPDPAEAEPA